MIILIIPFALPDKMKFVVDDIDQYDVAIKFQNIATLRR